MRYLYVSWAVRHDARAGDSWIGGCRLLVLFWRELPGGNPLRLRRTGTVATKIDISTFRDALARLDEALVERQAQPESSFIRDSVILRFTVAFEAAVSVLGRYLEKVARVSDTNRMSPRRRLREAADLGLISECADWMEHVTNHNRTVHAYSEPTADAISHQAVRFSTDARALFNAIAAGIADGG